MQNQNKFTFNTVRFVYLEPMFALLFSFNDKMVDYRLACLFMKEEDRI